VLNSSAAVFQENLFKAERKFFVTGFSVETLERFFQSSMLPLLGLADSPTKVVPCEVGLLVCPLQAVRSIIWARISANTRFIGTSSFSLAVNYLVATASLSMLIKTENKMIFH
jgi:hypothetical protein